VAALTLLIMAATALAVTGQLTQLPGTAGCVSEDGTGGDCTDGKALDGAFWVALSADGKSAYVASYYADAVAVLRRNTTTGELTQLPGTAGCVSESGSSGECADGKALERPLSVAVSPDGKNVYVGSLFSDAVAVFQRDATTGGLTQLPGTAGCVSETGTGEACADGMALGAPRSVTLSADGKSVYVASVEGDAVAVFRRDTTAGEITQLAGPAGCIGETGAPCRDGKVLDNPFSTAVSADGKNVYVASYYSDAVAVLRRDTTTGALLQTPGTGGCVSETGSGGVCVDGKALNGPNSVAMSPDGKNVYVASFISDAAAAFRRNTTTGGLTQLVGPAGKAGCVSQTGSSGVCSDGKSLLGPESVTLSADGKSVYVASYFSYAVAAFQRNPTSGVLSQLAGTAGCVSEAGSGGACADGKALNHAAEVAVSADGKSVYVASFGSDAVATFAREMPSSP
jgi:DNA-binding beta-propeller fold protein YncE